MPSDDIAQAIEDIRARVTRFEGVADESLTINTWYRGPNEWEPGAEQSDLLITLLDIAEAAYWVTAADEGCVDSGNRSVRLYELSKQIKPLLTSLLKEVSA